MARVYTKAVFERFEKTMKLATSYKAVRDDDGGPHAWLVQHSNAASKIVCGQHKFKIHANEDIGEFKCECNTWEQTGL